MNRPLCKIDGCHRHVKYTSTQLCNTHYERIRKHGTIVLPPRKKPRRTRVYTRIDPKIRFQDKYEVNPETGCWEWGAGMDEKGYGQFMMDNQKKTGAHKAAWLLFRGPIPEGLQIDHLCRVHHCVNPDHLEPVTPRENLLRGETLAAANVAKTHCIHGHEFTPDNLLKRKDGIRKCRECNRLYLKKRRELRREKANQ